VSIDDAFDREAVAVAERVDRAERRVLGCGAGDRAIGCSEACSIEPTRWRASSRSTPSAVTMTRRWVAVDTELEAWLRPFYQTANRLTALYWLRRELGDDRAWLVHLCFLKDPTHKSPELRSTREQWEFAFATAAEHLGLKKSVPNYAHVFLNGIPRPPTNLERPALF